MPLPINASTSFTSVSYTHLGFVVNVLIASFSPLKYIFLTGHMMWILSVAVAGSLYIGGFNETMIVVIGSILQGMLMVIFPAIGQPMAVSYTHLDVYKRQFLLFFKTHYSMIGIELKL